jgi:hypothetical protein
MGRFSRRASAAAGAALILSATFVSARPANADEVSGPPVARVSLSSGDVAVLRADANDAVAATINAPLLAGDALSTADGSRAEIQFDGRSTIRMDQDTEVRVVDLDPAHREVQLAGGAIDLREFSGYSGPDQVDTPSVSIRPDGAANIRIAVSDDGSTRITVRLGHAYVLTPQSSIALDPASTLVAGGPPATPAISYTASPALDDFDQFCQSRDQAVDATLSLPYINPAIGYADFSLYGRWVADPTYGEVWIPGVTLAGWAPYRYGRWVWEDGYGWCWIGDEPWGWAPYHYGRWFHSAQYGWAWYPPAVAVRPLWSPALVGFVTFGSVSIGVGFGSIAWVPLAPYEVYHPWYGWSGGHFGPTVVNNVTVTNVSITRVYANAGRTDAITGVSSQRFLAGSFDHPRPIAATQLTNAQAVRGTLPVAPTQRNLSFTTRPVPEQLAARTASTLTQRHFAGNATTSITRTPFEQQRATLTRLAPGGNGVPPNGAPVNRTPPYRSLSPEASTRMNATNATVRTNTVRANVATPRPAPIRRPPTKARPKPKPPRNDSSPQ